MRWRTHGCGVRDLPANLRLGLTLLCLLVALALAAPLLATEAPWLARDDDGLRAPALARFFGRPVPPVGSGSRVLIRAPIPHDPNRTRLEEVLAPPSTSHWLGTDALGRDMASRLIHGSRVSLSVGLMAAGLALLVGVPLGALAGYRGGWADAAISRAIEAVFCFPTLLLILILLAAAPLWLEGFSDTLRISLLLGLTGWVAVARYLRAEFLKVKHSDMVAAAAALGGGHLRIALRYILPCSLAPVLVTAAFTVGAAVVTEGALSFLGLGVQPPVATPS